MKDYSKKHLPAGLKKSLLAAAAFLLAALFVMSAANLLVVSLAAKYIIPFESAVSRGADSIVVLGAGVRANGTLTDILRDRVDTAAALYFAGAALYPPSLPRHPHPRHAQGRRSLPYGNPV